MLRQFVSLILLSIGFNLSAQAPNLDSLRRVVLQAESNRERADALAQYGNALPNFRSEEIMGLADSVLLLGESGAYYQATSDFLKGVSYFKSRSFPLAKKYLKLSIAELEGENEDLFFRAKNVLGLSYLYGQENDSAIYVFNDVLQTAPSNNLHAMYSANGNIGLAYKRIGEYGKAIYHFQESQKVDPANEYGNLNTTMNVSLMFLEMGLFEDALRSLRGSDVTEFEPQPIKSAYYNNLARVFYELNQSDSAEYYWKASIAINKQINRFDGLYFNQMTLAEKLLERENLVEAKAYLDSASMQLSYLRRPDDKFRYNLILGTYYYQNNQLDSAITRFNEHIENTASPRFLGLRGDVFLLLSQAYEEKGEIAKSNEYLKQHNALGENMREKERERFLAEAKANYLLAVKEGDLDASNQKIEVYTMQRILLIVAVFVLIIILYIYFRNYRKTVSGLAVQAAENVNLSKQIEKQKTQIIELKSKAILEAEEIVAVKSDGNYLEFYLKSKDKPEIDRNRLKNVLEVLPDYFVQIHRSYIINLKEVRIKFSDKVEMKNGEVLPVSRTYKDNLKDALSKFGLGE
ncbi:LytTR family transcriptional regulator DNA-binding domain-containing protein [Roseivirga pacifica]|uniref:LytTR family transcriptional regulator DNA-binding domain-containing protein n=1 Tax=Roseivirga pacifica TaxID=1267423 RepID=UPI00227BF76E|nr:LytTR family transcriptional regulator DNA-binding domain-containing protein [Roseivirga pacifica]